MPRSKGKHTFIGNPGRKRIPVLWINGIFSTLKNVRATMKQHRNFINNLLRGASMCDTDLYSIILSLNNTSKD